MHRRQITLRRHESRRRTLRIASIVHPGAQMRRMVFTAPELHDFVSAGSTPPRKA
jgi:NADPH-dependent ferric siderophore reductase